MTTPASPHPLGSAAPERDYVGLAIGTLAFAIVFGLGLNAVVALVVRTLQSSGTATQELELGAPPAVVLFAGTFLSCFAAAIATWRFLAPVKNAFRQGMLAMLTFFASFVVSLVTMPIDRAFGRGGLAGLAAVALLAAFLLARRIARTTP